MDETETTTEERTVRETARSRRSVLAFGGVALVTGLTGCSTSSESQTPTTSDGSELAHDISFDEKQLVVDLQKEHSVDRVNLINPDGTTFSSKSLAEGASRVGFQILEIEPGRGGYSHYTPGEHTLTFVRENGQSVSRSLPLRPDISVIGISEWDSDESTTAKNAKITLENRGNGPTWIYNIAYRGAPNESANELGDNPGIPMSYLRFPNEARSTIVPPGEQRSFVGSPPPFWFQSRDTCEGDTIQFETVVQIATGRNLRQAVTGSFTGGVATKQEAAGQERYACANAEFQLKDGEE